MNEPLKADFVPLEAALSHIESEIEPCGSELVELGVALDRVLAHRVALGGDSLTAGRWLNAEDVYRLSESGFTSVMVVRQPRVGVLATGDELVPPGTPLSPGQIPNSSTPLVSACVRRWGGRPLDVGVAADHPGALCRHLEFARQHSADLIVTVGGTGRGDYDFLRSLLETEGSIVVDGVAIRGGHTTMFGRYRGCPMFALPGTPSACRISLEEFVRPAVLRLGGRPTAPVTVPARVVNGFRVRPLPSFEWARMSRSGVGFEARRIRGPGVGIWTSMVRANALLVIPGGAAVIEAGEVLEAQLLDAVMI